MKRPRLTDLARERRVRSNISRLGQMLAGNPELARRTRAALTGRLAAPDLEEQTMAKEEQVTIRLPKGFLDRAGKLARNLAADPAHSPPYRVTRAAVLRLAMLRGVEALEGDLTKKKN